MKFRDPGFRLGGREGIRWKNLGGKIFRSKNSIFPTFPMARTWAGSLISRILAKIRGYKGFQGEEDAMDGDVNLGFDVWHHN